MACCAGCGSSARACPASEGAGVALQPSTPEPRTRALHRDMDLYSTCFTLLEAEVFLDVRDAHAMQPIAIRIA